MSDAMLSNTINWYELNENYFNKISKMFSTFSKKNEFDNSKKYISNKEKNLNKLPWMLFKFKFKFYFLIHEISLCIEKIEKINKLKEMKNDNDNYELNLDNEIKKLFILSVKSLIVDVNNDNDKFEKNIDKDIDIEIDNYENYLFESSNMNLLLSIESIDIDHVQAVDGGVCKLIGTLL